MDGKLSISSCWSSGRHKDGYEMITEAVDLGFTEMELSHGIRMSLLPGILKAVEEKLIRISSVHNFCPLPPGIHYPAPNLYQPSSGDRREIIQWERYTRQTIDFAHRIEAPRIVTHLGSVSFFWRSPALRLRKFIQQAGDQFDARAEVYQQFRERVLGRLQRKRQPYWERTLKSLELVLPEAREKGVVLCIENRENFEELPFDDQFASLFEHFRGETALAAWHDTGHASLKQRYGFLEHQEFLRQTADRLAGFHLHDVTREGKDHQEIGTGQIDFPMVASFFQPDHSLVLELSPGLSREQVLASREAVEKLLPAIAPN